MLFHAFYGEQILDEIQTTGITYLRTKDWLLFAPMLKGSAIDPLSVIGLPSPSDLLYLIAVNGKHIGAVCMQTRLMICHYWNNSIPSGPIPAAHFADIIDAVLTDMQWPMKDLYGERFDAVLAVHQCAREFIEQSGPVPPAIIDRIQRDIGFEQDTFH